MFHKEFAKEHNINIHNNIAMIKIEYKINNNNNT